MKLIFPVKIDAESQPDLRPVDSGKFVKVFQYKIYVSDIQYLNFGHYTIYIEYAGNFCTLLVPDGFRSDGASVPRWLWGVLGLRPDGLHRAASLIHDFICSRRGRKILDFGNSPYLGRMESKDAHKLFGVMLEASGVPKWQAKLMYRAVRLFGPRWSFK